MKKIFFAIFLINSAMLLQAQDDSLKPGSDSVEVNLISLPDSTAIAIPNGKLITKEIGVAGGAIISDDGKVELIFPEGALLKNTSVSIQPTENLLPNGNKAYHFEPSGMQFLKPVQVIFHYSDDEAETCPPEFKFMALQDHNGKWEYMDYEDWDSASKSLKGSIKHFSAFVDGNTVELNPTELTLKVGATYKFSLNVVQPPAPPNTSEPGDDDLAPLPRAVNKGNRSASWKVNGKVGGSVIQGTISPIPAQPIQAIYKAPSGLSTDTITVTLELDNFEFKKQSRSRIGSKGLMLEPGKPKRIQVAGFSCKVKLYAEYKVTVSQNIKVEGGQMTDSSFFNLKVSFSERAVISEIKNQLAKVKIKQTKCKAIYVNESTCTGVINVTGLKTSNIAPGTSSDDFAWVFLYFKPAPFVFPVINLPPCGINMVSLTTPPVNSPYAFPVYIKFLAKNERQYISLGMYAGEPVKRPIPEDITATIEPILE